MQFLQPLRKKVAKNKK